MASLDDIKNVLREEKENFLKLGINQVGVFGSFVRGEAGSDSDIDILIDVDPASNLTLFSLIGIEQKLSEKLNRRIDIVIKSDLKPNIGKRILSEVMYA